MFSLCVKLEQHTPIIHFLSSQDGATLRATELKPKLDKFLIEKCGKDPSLDMRIGSGLESKPALAYKVSICQRGQRIVSRTDSLPMFFGNQKKKPEKLKAGILYDGVTELTFFALNPNLVQLIKDNIAEFFAKTNFGMRQSKGYGSFYIHPEDSNKIYREIRKEDGYKLSFNLDANDWEAALKQIDYFYKFLRSGINEVTDAKLEEKNGSLHQTKTNRSAYCKPVIFLYAIDRMQGAQWDKKSIKEAFLNKKEYRRRTNRKESQKYNDKYDSVITMGLPMQKEIYSYDNKSPLHYDQKNDDPTKLLLRDLFGLSLSQKWGSYGANLNKKHVYKDKKEKTDQIQRLKSPITFKMLEDGEMGFTVYLFAEQVDEKGILNEKFIVNMRGKGIKGKLNLKFPSQFSWDDFFDYLCKKVEIKEVFQEGRNTDIYNNINHILKQIQV